MYLSAVRSLTRVSTNSVVEEHLRTAKSIGLQTREQMNVNCCYANQSKCRVIDPDGVEWELLSRRL
jgi:hypothetical protein